MKAFSEYLGLVASVALPFFNIPLIMRMIQRKSSADLSLVWVVGVFVCIVLVQPAGWYSVDFIFKTYNIINLAFFSVVTGVAIYYRKK